jgi:signal transduction histidine kinase
MSAEIIVQALIVAAVTALATGFINSRIMESHLKDLRERIVRIEKYLNGLLRDYKDK